MKQELINLFMGILSGDGDIGGRMASSYENAKPAYNSPLDQYVDRLNRDFTTGKYSDLSQEDRLKLANTLADEVLQAWKSPN